MQSLYASYPCGKCGKTTKVHWIPVEEKRKNYYTYEELQELKRSRPPKVDKPIFCHYCKSVVYTATKEDREYKDITGTKKRIR